MTTATNGLVSDWDIRMAARRNRFLPKLLFGRVTAGMTANLQRPK
jgi:hypothetical protein